MTAPNEDVWHWRNAPFIDPLSNARHPVGRFHMAENMTNDTKKPGSAGTHTRYPSGSLAEAIHRDVQNPAPSGMASDAAGHLILGGGGQLDQEPAPAPRIESIFKDVDLVASMEAMTDLDLPNVMEQARQRMIDRQIGLNPGSMAFRVGTLEPEKIRPAFHNPLGLAKPPRCAISPLYEALEAMRAARATLVAVASDLEVPTSTNAAALDRVEQLDAAISELQSSSLFKLINAGSLYQGAADAAEYWKRRALEAEQRMERVVRDAEAGPAFMGEPVYQHVPGQIPLVFMRMAEWLSTYMGEHHPGDWELLGIQNRRFDAGQGGDK